MSSAKFAPVTSALLTRKGAAHPSFLNGDWGPLHEDALVAAEAPLDFRSSAAPLRDFKADSISPHAAPHPSQASAAAPEKRRVVLTLRKEDFDRLGIAAVKQETTRSHLACHVLLTYLEGISRDYGSCRCLSGGSCDCG